MSQNFTATELYGGAIVASIPANYLDASEMRQIPDNQEVRLSPTSLTSIIFEIVERVEPPSHPCTTDEEALRYHLEDIISTQPERSTGRTDSEERTLVIHPPRSIEAPRLPSDIATLTMFAIQEPQKELNGNRNAEATQSSYTALFVTLIRLEIQKTDIIATVTVPHVPSEAGYIDLSQLNLEAGVESSLMREGRAICEQIRQSLQIVDWALFSAA